MSKRARRPELMVLSAVAAVGVVAIIATIAIIDQSKRIHDPETYAEKRCEANLGPKFTHNLVPPGQNDTFEKCVVKERNKSTISSILPLFIAGIVVIVLGVSGMFVGREQLRRDQELTRKLKGG